jgi:hypothetical protein
VAARATREDEGDNKQEMRSPRCMRCRNAVTGNVSEIPARLGCRCVKGAIF